MIPQRSAFTRRAAAFAVLALALLAVVVPAWGTAASSSPTATPTTTTPAPAAVSTPALTAALLASAPTVPTGGIFGYTAQIRLAQPASYLQAVLEISRPSGQLLFRRTRVANNVQAQLVDFPFERQLTDVLSLAPGSYPVRLTVSADVAGSTISTQVAGTLRVYSKDGPRLRAALVARVTGSPQSSPDGRFAVDPARSIGARNAVNLISRRVLTDPNARVTLAVAPLLLAEWRRLSGGYTLTDGTTIRPDHPVPVAYNSTLADLRAAIDTGRLELVTLGYADPNLTDLANQGLAKDVGPQYEAGLSAVFQSLEVTPSSGTVPAGGSLPPNEVGILAQKNVRYVVVHSKFAREGKSSHPDSGVYPVTREKLLALVTDESVSKSLATGASNKAVDAAFDRLTRFPKQPLVMSVEIDGDSFAATDSVGAALSAFEMQPWLELTTAGSLKPATGAAKVRLLAGESTPNAPKGFWKSVASSRSYADAYYAAIGASDPGASTAAQQSLVAESSAWSDPNATWAGAPRGLEFAAASLKTTKPVLDGIRIKVEPITLSGAKGDIPITVVNPSDKTLDVLVTVTSSGGVRVGSSESLPTTLRPQETYIEVPVDMQTSLSGKLTVEVSAGGIALARRTVTVRASYLDRLALGGAVVIALLGMLVFIVRRTRAAERADGDSDGGAGYTDHDDSDARPSSR